MVGLDIHSEPGIIKVNQKLVKESGSVVTDFIKIIVPCSDGYTYGFGDNKNVYKRTGGGTWTLAVTLPNVPFGAIEYNGYIYVAYLTHLARWQIGDPWSTRNDTFGAFTNGTQ